MKKAGKIRTSYPLLKKDGDLAELIGVVLGDGHIRKYPRTEELSIFSNSNNPGFVKRYSKLVEKLFGQKPAITQHGSKNCTRIRIYQKHIQKRIGVPYSPRGPLTIEVPGWILRNNQYIVRYLRGLYEAEGSHCIHLPTSTYKLFFSNRNRSMLANVDMLLKKLGFASYISLKNWSVQVSRKAEVARAIELLEFRKY
jgi:DNA-binding transcriptional regulator WhiA